MALLSSIKYKISTISHILHSNLCVDWGMMLRGYSIKVISSDIAIGLINQYALPENICIKDVSVGSLVVLYDEVIIVRAAAGYFYCVPNHQLN